jgi:hypothetical protein
MNARTGVSDRNWVSLTTPLRSGSQCIGVYADATPALSSSNLVDAIEQGRSMDQIAKEHGVAITTVRVELHRRILVMAITGSACGTASDVPTNWRVS